jgi:hypothetical protein
MDVMALTIIITNSLIPLKIKKQLPHYATLCSPQVLNDYYEY